jgi:hypothetical protein
MQNSQEKAKKCGFCRVKEANSLRISLAQPIPKENARESRHNARELHRSGHYIQANRYLEAESSGNTATHTPVADAAKTTQAIDSKTVGKAGNALSNCEKP